MKELIADARANPGRLNMSNTGSGFHSHLSAGGEERSTNTPELPTIAEASVPGHVWTGWLGLVTPRGVSRPVLKLAQCEVK